MIEFKKRSPEEKLMGYLAKLTTAQLIGVGKLLKVEKESVRKIFMENELEDLVVGIAVKFLEKNRQQRREIMEFIKEVAEDNKVENETKEDGDGE